MEDIRFRSFSEDPNFPVSRVYEWEKDVNFREENKDCAVDEDEATSFDSMLHEPSSRLIRRGFTRSNCTDEMLMFINAGEETTKELEPGFNVLGDTYFDGGNVLRTDESIIGAGRSFIYQSARVGNFCYRFDNLLPGEYFIDLHFAEIINTNGPKGMRVFNVHVQEEKVLSELDIFSVVGANKPLQLVDLRVAVTEDGTIRVRFEGVNGSPMVCGICVRKAPKVPAPRVPNEIIKCNSCAAEIEISPTQKKLMRTKAQETYEKKIQELTMQCQLKANECHEAWMSLTSTNEQLEKVRMELDNKTFETRSLDVKVGEQAENLRKISGKYETAKKRWAEAINDLHKKIKEMKNEHSQLSQEAHECADSIPELSKMVAGVQSLVSQCEDLKVKYSEEQAKRKELYNQIQETKGNIRVFCRCRPLSKNEISARCTTVVDFEAAKDGELGILTSGTTKKTFRFDRVYTPKDGQADVFADASPVVISVLDGYNVCIFAYGQTGTGKTFTMEGTAQNRGVNYRTVEQLFEIAKERGETFTYDICVSVLEVYNEQIRDLLATSPSSKKLEIKQAPHGSHHVPGLVEAKVNNINEVWSVLQAGSNARAVGSNNVNEHSSRSHCMLCIMVNSKNLMNGECTKSKLWLVDLAGSERLAKTDVQGERLKEAQNINRSLSALGDVISALATKNSHIPYRNSRLTHLLQDSLGGDSKTLMFVQISPSEQDLSETLSSLNFATRVRGVELSPAKKQVDTGELQKIKTMLEKSKQECRSKDESIKKLEESIQNLESKTKGRDQIYRTQQEKIKELENQLNATQSQAEMQVTQFSDTCSGLRQKVKELETKLKERQQSESATYQQKVKELENKLTESESRSFTLEQKNKELEMKLKDAEQNLETDILRQQIKELQDKLMELEQQQKKSMQNHEIPDMAKATPHEAKTIVRDDDLINDIEPHILKSSNSVNRPMSHGSSLPRKYDSFHETRKRRESRTGETENSGESSIYTNEKKIRKSDPPRIPTRAMRPTKPNPSTQATSVAQKRGIRDPMHGVKEREIKKKIWSR